MMSRKTFKKLPLLALAAALPLSSALMVGPKQAAAAWGAFGPGKITVTEQVDLYNAPNLSSGVAGAISPQTVELSRLDSGRPETWPEKNGWFAIDTWLGKKYILPANYLYGELQEDSSTILLETVTPIYDQPTDGPVLQQPIAALSPQAVEATSSAESDGYSGWHRVKTWLGDKWVMGGIPVERIDETITYSKPFTVFNKLRGEATEQLKPQTVKAIARATAPYGSYWTYVQTDAGYRWLVATEPTDETIVIDHNVVIYSGEFGGQLQEAGELGPQTVQAFEKVKGLDDWYHIHSSWKGDVWIWIHVEKQPTTK